MASSGAGESDGPGNKFVNDGSFMEMFKKRMEQQSKGKSGEGEKNSSSSATGPPRESTQGPGVATRQGHKPLTEDDDSGEKDSSKESTSAGSTGAGTVDAATPKPFQVVHGWPLERER